MLKICVPSLFSAEAGWIGVCAAAMLGRTVADLVMIRLQSVIERTIITRDRAAFQKNIVMFISAMIPVAGINAGLKFGLGQLAIRCRQRLTNHLLTKYFKDSAYYRLSALDNRVSHADQVLVQDVEKWAHGLTDCFSNLSKPIVDVCIYTARLTSGIGIQGPLAMLVYLAISGALLTSLRKPLARLTVEEQKLEGGYRGVHSRLVTNAEEVAFFRGEEKERRVILGKFGGLVRHLEKLNTFRHLKMGAPALLWGGTIALGQRIHPPFDKRFGVSRRTPKEEANIMEMYYTQGRMLVNMAQAMGRVVLAGRELTRLAGLTARVAEFESVLEDVSQGKYHKPSVRREGTAAAMELVPNSGTRVEGRLIKFEKVPIVTPNGEVLIPSLSVDILPGHNVLIVGPNGAGKSSLFRILSGLWPMYGGKITVPPQEQLFFVPQRPYLAMGPLRDQITYPWSAEEAAQRGVKDSDLLHVMKQVQLENIVVREGGLDATNDWSEVLSGGEKQRVAMARLFLHRPLYAILDESTSAVSMDVEGYLYSHCRELGITLITVSHRKTLYQYHDFVLNFDGTGGYEFKAMAEAHPPAR
eukprot:tig00000227_g19839.t1